ncbi:MAG: ATP-binding protein, partial [Lentisphaerota bacterium]
EAMIDFQIQDRAQQAAELSRAHDRKISPAGKRLVIRTYSRMVDDDFCGKNRGFVPGSYGVLSISDTGIGMTPEVQEHLFEPFYTTTGVGRGSGLGLSTVYGIVKQLGGSIRVQSAPGKGSHFEIYLRVATAKEIWTRRDEPVQNLKGSETILVVEDEDAVRGLIVRILKALGYQTLEAAHGGEGLTICQTYQKPIDLIISDLIMPHVSGKQFIEEVRKTRKDIKVLFVSGYSNVDTVNGETLGVDTPLIQKPFTKESLAARIREILENRWKPAS